MASPIELAYMAGVLDSDGCITIGIVRPKKDKKSYSANLIVTASQMRTDALNMFAEHFGGKVYLKLAGGRDIYVWRVNGSSAEKVVQELYPYLRVKRTQAALAQEFVAQRNSQDQEIRRLCPQGHLYDKENTQYTKRGWKYCKICKRLRKRGELPSYSRAEYNTGRRLTTEQEILRIGFAYAMHIANKEFL